jgi:hypothetical protein
MTNKITAYNATIELLKKLSVKHTSHNFSSGAIMLDIWQGDKFIVLHFEDDFIGFSEIKDDNIGFDNIPDEKFYDSQQFIKKIEFILNG